MNNKLGRDKMWNESTWQDVDEAVLAEVGRIRVVQKVFPSTTIAGASHVPADIFDPKTMSIAEGQTKPLIELSVEFPLTQSQVQNEATLKTSRTLARLATKSLALAEDLLFFQGAAAPLPPEVKVVNRNSVDGGLLGAAQNVIKVTPLDGKPGVYGENTFKAVIQGISTLTGSAQPGPYALILESEIHADTYAPLPTTLVTTADRITPLVTGGFYGTGTLPTKTGLLVSLGGEPTTVYLGQEAATAYTQEDQDGNARFRVYERVQVIARDARAFVRLEFE
jgi:uncharacterized linocin/CFP29 family protein